MWIWHRKMSAENHGLEIIKPATKRLSEADIPTNWRDHIEAVNSKPKLESKATPKPRHAVDDDFIRTSDFGFLLEKGWRRNGEHFARPGTEKAVSASIVAAEDGTRLLHVFSSNGDPFEKDSNYNPFDAFKLLFHDGNAEAARADLLKQGYGRLRIPLLTCRQLDGNDYQQTYLIPGVYVPKQPCLVGGPRKGMKTSILIALAIALAACLRFLGHFVVTRPVKVIILSGESGMATLQETARRIAKSMGLLLSEIENLFWSDFLPRLDDAQHLDALERMIEETGCEVLIVDPAYLCLPGGDAGNIFIQGSLLRNINEICQRHGVGLVLAHHFRKRAKAKSAADFDPPELDDLSWSGFAEFARQWILLGRRESYEPGSGEHRLWMSVGGSAGHSALWGVDISEGVSGEPRHWNVELLTPDEARVEKKGGIIRQRLLDAMREFPEGTTKTLLFDTAKPKLRNEPSTRNVLDALITEGLLVACDIRRTAKPTLACVFRPKPTKHDNTFLRLIAMYNISDPRYQDFLKEAPERLESECAVLRLCIESAMQENRPSLVNSLVSTYSKLASVHQQSQIKAGLLFERDTTLQLFKGLVDALTGILKEYQLAEYSEIVERMIDSVDEVFNRVTNEKQPLLLPAPEKP